MKRNICYMAVQVCERWPDGRLKTWYDGEQHGNLPAAWNEARLLAKEFPRTRYQVISREIVEIGKELVKAK